MTVPVLSEPPRPAGRLREGRVAGEKKTKGRGPQAFWGGGEGGTKAKTQERRNNGMETTKMLQRKKKNETRTKTKIKKERKLKRKGPPGQSEAWRAPGSITGRKGVEK